MHVLGLVVSSMLLLLCVVIVFITSQNSWLNRSSVFNSLLICCVGVTLTPPLQTPPSLWMYTCIHTRGPVNRISLKHIAWTIPVSQKLFNSVVLWIYNLFSSHLLSHSPSLSVLPLPPSGESCNCCGLTGTVFDLTLILWSLSSHERDEGRNASP